MVRLEPRPLSLLWLHAALIAPRSPLMGKCMILQIVSKTALKSILIFLQFPMFRLLVRWSGHRRDVETAVRNIHCRNVSSHRMHDSEEPQGPQEGKSKSSLASAHELECILGQPSASGCSAKPWIPILHSSACCGATVQSRLARPIVAKVAPVRTLIAKGIRMFATNTPVDVLSLP